MNEITPTGELSSKSDNEVTKESIKNAREFLGGMSVLRDEDRESFAQALVSAEFGSEEVQQFLNKPEDRQDSPSMTQSSWMKLALPMFNAMRWKKEGMEIGGELSMAGYVVQLGMLSHYLIRLPEEDWGRVTPPFNVGELDEGWSDEDKASLSKLRELVESSGLKDAQALLSGEVLNESTESDDIIDQDKYFAMLAGLCMLRVEEAMNYSDVDDASGVLGLSEFESGAIKGVDIDQVPEDIADQANDSGEPGGEVDEVIDESSKASDGEE